MIASFRHKGLARLFLDNDASQVRSDLVKRCQVRLRALHAARTPQDLNLPGFNFHRLLGAEKRYTLHVNGPWCITFAWEEGNAVAVDLEQYH